MSYLAVQVLVALTERCPLPPPSIIRGLEVKTPLALCPVKPRKEKEKKIGMYTGGLRRRRK